MSNLGGNKVLQGQSREIVYNVYKYFMSLRPDPVGHITAVKEQVTQATGVTLRTVERIIKEGRNFEERNLPVVFDTPGQKRPRIPTVTNLEEFDTEELRVIIYNCYKTENCPVTIRLLKQKLKWGGSKTSLWKIVRQLGFRWKQAQNSKKLLIEKSDIRAVRITYLQLIQFYREQNRSIVYLCGESQHGSKCGSDARLIIIHAGGASGLLPDCLCIFSSGVKGKHHNMNSVNYEQWLKEKLIPNLPQYAVVVVGNAFYNNQIMYPVPTSDSKKVDMVNWLREKNISFNPTMLKPQLYDIIKQHRRHHVNYNLNFMLKERGHTVLRLPPHHSDLNPMEILLGNIKKNMAEKSTSFTMEAVQTFALREFESVAAQNWWTIWESVIQNEYNYLANEYFIDAQTEKVVMNAAGDANGESEDDSDDYHMTDDSEDD